jgi:hypothetical protein
VRDSQLSIAGSRPGATTITTTMSKDSPRIFAGDDPSATQCVVVVIEALIQILASWAFYTETDAMAYRHADLCISICGRRRYEGRTYVRYAMSSTEVRPALLRLCYQMATISLPCLSSMYNTVPYRHSAVALTCQPAELSGCSTTVTEVLNSRDGKPHPLTSRPIPTTDKRFGVAKKHIVEDQILMS